jgi:hypothetical protein
VAFNSGDLDAVNSAMASGELIVRFQDGRQVQYRSVEELAKAKRYIEAEINSDGVKRRQGVFKVNVGKGV